MHPMSADRLSCNLDLAPRGSETGMPALALGSSAFLALGTLPVLHYLVLLALPLGIAAIASGVRALRRGVAATSGRIASVTGIMLGALGVLGWAGLMVLWYLLEQATSH
ncbi:hypothetical protein ACIPWI_14445 [Streptomyces sp. NPDC090046]|uniref:hypothetical protein n=1 Tax=Streptomyces sp. NPDC090046 TaxID=3365928 RepID=UPI003802E9DC